MADHGVVLAVFLVQSELPARTHIPEISTFMFIGAVVRAKE
jgi:hypothetical protein